MDPMDHGCGLRLQMMTENNIFISDQPRKQQQPPRKQIRTEDNSDQPRKQIQRENNSDHDSKNNNHPENKFREKTIQTTTHKTTTTTATQKTNSDRKQLKPQIRNVNNSKNN